MSTYHPPRDGRCIARDNRGRCTNPVEDDSLYCTRHQPRSTPRATSGTVARRFALEAELREQARQLLALEAGALATGPTSFVDLEAALDYVQTLVQDGTR